MIDTILRYKTVILLSAILLVLSAFVAKVSFTIDKQEAHQNYVNDLATKDQDALRAMLRKHKAE
jgi:hypothetical protein